MASKKYLSLEEAAEHLRIKSDELIRLREKGDIRGFADRGTWKFKFEDVEELGRRRQPDSSPEVPMLEEDDEFSRQPTIITKGRGGTSDSDVRLVPEAGQKSSLTGSSAELPVMADTDSDVRLSDERKARAGSDSDVKLVTPKSADSDSDVKLADTDSDVRLSDSDSDVRLAPIAPSDSDVKLVSRRAKKEISSDSDVTLSPKAGAKKGMFDDVPLSGSDSVLLEDSGAPLAGDSGISLEGNSSLPLMSGSSGVLVGAGSAIDETDDGIEIGEDSGISFEADSGIQLAADSGISLGADSGIRLGGDSSIRLADSGRKGKTPADDLDSGVPLLLSKDRNAGGTDVEVPMLDESDEMETINLATTPGKKQADTSVEFFEDEAAGLDDEYEPVDVADDDELEVAEDILGEDDEIDQLEVFDSDDSLFDESFVEGGSAANIPVSRIALPYQAEWSTQTVLLAAASAVALSIGAMLAVDLLRLTWAGVDAPMYQQHSGTLISLVSGFFK
jgi:excisionase family DNA binding protein